MHYIKRTWLSGGTLGAFLDPGGLYNDPKMSVGSFEPTTRLMIAARSLLEFFWGGIIASCQCVRWLELTWGEKLVADLRDQQPFEPRVWGLRVR